jgi:undecaprenol kinase
MTRSTLPHRRPGVTPPPDLPSDLPDDLAALAAAEAWLARAGRRTLREKLLAGLSGLKHAARGDSSFFAHGYRVLLVALTAAMLGLSLPGWCILVLAFSLILLAELNHSAVDTLARSIGDPDEPRLKVAREIAAAGVLISVVASAAVAIALLTLRLGDLLGWWR